jgi:hypothetical protein
MFRITPKTQGETSSRASLIADIASKKHNSGGQAQGSSLIRVIGTGRNQRRKGTALDPPEKIFGPGINNTFRLAEARKQFRLSIFPNNRARVRITSR